MSESSQSRPAGGRDLLAALVVCLLLAGLWIVPMRASVAWGWDETMHAELPALRMLFGVQEGDWASAWGALQDCNRYPFAYPVLLAAVQAVVGPSEHACRVVGTLLWCATLFGLFLLARELRPGLERRVGRAAASFAPWLALGAGASSPLALGYAGTLFLEVPFACVAVYALRAWLRAELCETGSTRGHLIAGAWLCLAFFTKFNYALLLWAGLGADWISRALVARRFRSRSFWNASGALALVPGLALAWWFFWPWPSGRDVAAVHRAGFLDFLSGNTGHSTPGSYRLLFTGAFLVPTLRVGLALLVGLLASLRDLGQPGVRVLWWTFLAFALPIYSHSFFLDRFMIPMGVALWVLAAVGWARLLPRAVPQRAWVLGAAVLALACFPGADAPRLAAGVGLLQSDPAVRAYQVELFAGWRDLSGGRLLRSAGLKPSERDAFLDMLATEVGPEERVGWVGITPEVSPAGLHFGLWQRGGSKRRFLEQAHVPFYVSFTAQDPLWDEARLAAFASRFDVILATDPVEITGRGGREFLRGYRQRLETQHGFEARALGRLSIARPLAEDLSVEVYALRKR